MPLRPQAVQPHIGKCFDGIRRLDFGSDPKSTEIQAVYSGASFASIKCRDTFEARSPLRPAEPCGGTLCPAPTNVNGCGEV